MLWVGASFLLFSEVQACFAEQWTRWAFGSDELALDCALRDLVDLHAAEGGTLPGLVAASTQLVHFQARLGAGGDSDGPAATGLSVPGAWTDPDGFLGDPTAPGDTDPDQALDVAWTVTSDWTGGWCADVVVGNTSDQVLIWALVAELGGPLESWWSSEAALQGARVRFSGEWWNLDLAPGASTDFGFCMDR